MSLSRSIDFFRIRSWQMGLALAPALLLLGCGAPKRLTPEEERRLALCPPAQATHEFAETPWRGGKANILSFQGIRASINTSCASCHQVPAKTGGFTYVNSWRGQELTIGGTTTWYPGFFEAAEKMQAAMVHADSKKRMPPEDRRGTSPEIHLELARQLASWIKAGKPDGTFEDGKTAEIPIGKPRPGKPNATTDIGDCIPVAKAVGYDYAKDKFFESTETLPKFLTDTDIFTLDPLALAEHGTLSYNVEYPLWADNAEKGRWIHVPMVLKDGELKKQSIEFDAVTGHFRIPPNTRFYKTFYRAVKLPNKKTLMKRIETRIIVARTPWEKSLFGTYQWDETEQTATLVTAPYRDGTPWKDMVFDVVVDIDKKTTRPYAIPGRQRCFECHMGSPSQNGVLGFQPLQINRRPLGGAARIDPVSSDELGQVARFISYGLISGIKSAQELPVLENSGGERPQNEFELRANGYTVGNCYHCHNPSGLAFTKENGIQLGLGPGQLFRFNTHQMSVQIPTRKLVHQNGLLDNSHLWRKVSDSAQQLGMFSQMPMHTPGAPDCRVLTVIGKWIRSFESLQAAYEFTPVCKSENPFHWIDMDFTWVNSDVYTPRRADWKDPEDGMPAEYRALELTSGLASAIRSEYPVGYWLKKPECNFPTVDLPPEKRRPWMMIGDKPKRPYGEVYSTTPGSYFFRTTCIKCHGPRADGNSSLARGILNWSGGNVRVANLVDGMFGKRNDNLKTFEMGGKNYGGNYLIWMAMEGTRVQFPPELSSYMGKHGGQMLNGIREKCLAQISSDKPSSPRFMDHEIFNKVCFIENLAPGHPDLLFDPQTNKPLHPEKVEAWLDRGAWNAGWALFEFLKEAASDNWPPSPDQCEQVYGTHAKE